MTPRVSVLIAVHNGGDNLRRAVDSVLAQTFEDFELLLVDDASTDAAVEDVAHLDRRIRVLRNPQNVGQAPSLNRGLNEALGQYIARLDHDDLCRPTRLERQVAVLDAEPRVALIGTWVDVIDERDRLYTRLKGRLPDFPSLLFWLIVDRPPLAHPALLYRRDVIRNLGGYDATFAPAEDKDLYRRLALARYEVRIVEEPLVAYRRHPQQLSQLRREAQKLNDERSQEIFLAALARDRSAAHRLRLVFSGDQDTWSELSQIDPADAITAVRRLLWGATSSLALDDYESERLTRLVMARLARSAIGAWRCGPRAQRAWALPIFDHALREAPGAVAPLVPLLTGALVTGPLLLPIARVLRTGARTLVVLPLLQPIRRVLRRSRPLRWLYARARSL